MKDYEILESAEVNEWPLIYVLGSFDSRITFFSQQVRAFNLAHALALSGRLPTTPRIAVMGAGAAGLSVAAGLAILLPPARIDVFERDQAPLHLQRGCSKRNLHPHIYEWPAQDAVDSNAGLPYLDWSAGSAAEVAGEVIQQFEILQACTNGRLNLRTLSEVTGIQQHADDYLLSYRKAGNSDQEPEVYHAVIIAIGFGRERELVGAKSYSYWSDRGIPDAPRYAPKETTYLVSGAGDGALIDLCAAAIQDFNHTALIEKVINWPGIDRIKSVLLSIDKKSDFCGPSFDFMAAYNSQLDCEPVCISLVKEISKYVRHRAKFVLNTKHRLLLRQPTSTLNRFMAYLVFQAAEYVGRPIVHIVGTMTVDACQSDMYDFGNEKLKAGEVFVRHGADKVTAFTAIDTIRNAYQKDHERWLKAMPNRSKPPQLTKQAKDALTNALVDAQIPLISWRNDNIFMQQGWQRFAAWSRPSEDVDRPYLLDANLRVRFTGSGGVNSHSVLEAIEELRAQLSQPKSVIRLVGLSGVGKTRFVQTLFDDRVGASALEPDNVLYTDMNSEPIPSPVQRASELISSQRRTVLIVDNCGPALHRELTNICLLQTSKLSMVTIEYDVRDDNPEDTLVVRLEASSDGLIEQLLLLRYPLLHAEDARRLAGISGGNARVALSLAPIAIKSGNLSALTDEILFTRLFDQGHSQNHQLLRAAQICSLLYSFDGETFGDENSELKHLAVLAEQTPMELYRHIQELLRRELAQRRGKWRAILPHAIANRMAARALDDLPVELVEHQFVRQASDRILLSFTRRLSYLHESTSAIRLAKRLLDEGGAFGDFSVLADVDELAVGNIAPVAPLSVVAAMERLSRLEPNLEVVTLGKHVNLLARIAYDGALFDRCIALLRRVALKHSDSAVVEAVTQTIASFFRILMPGTHASASQRLQLVEDLTASPDTKIQTLGLRALRSALEYSTIRASFDLEFGARLRNVGVMPETEIDFLNWYRRSLNILKQHMKCSESAFLQGRDLLAQCFKTICQFDPLVGESCCLLQESARGQFWYEGWTACCKALSVGGNSLSQTAREQIRILVEQLAPRDLVAKVRGTLDGDGVGYPDVGSYEAYDKKCRHSAVELGELLAQDSHGLTSMLPKLIQGGRYIHEIGAGLGNRQADNPECWPEILRQWQEVPSDNRSPGLLCGYLKQVAMIDEEKVQKLLDQCLDLPSLSAVLPTLQASIGFDICSIARMLAVFGNPNVLVDQYSALGGIFWKDPQVGVKLAPLLMSICGLPEGIRIAQRVVVTWLTFAHDLPSSAISVIQAVCQYLLIQAPISLMGEHDDHALSQLARFCLVGDHGDTVSATIALKLCAAVQDGEAHTWDYPDFKKSLLATQPFAVLNALYGASEEQRVTGIAMLAPDISFSDLPAEAIGSRDLLVWCYQGDVSRFKFAASFIALLCTQPTGEKVMTEQAIALLDSTPDPAGILSIYGQRLHPSVWSGSLAVILESNAEALNSLPSFLATRLKVELDQVREKLLVEAKERRQEEYHYKLSRDEGFEGVQHSNLRSHE